MQKYDTKLIIKSCSQLLRDLSNKNTILKKVHPRFERQIELDRSRFSQDFVDLTNLTILRTQISIVEAKLARRARFVFFMFDKVAKP